IWEAFRGSWNAQGVRPANQPRQRLRQYLRWVRERPHWPDLLLGWARSANDLRVAEVVWSGVSVRRQTGFARRWGAALGQITGNAIARPRADHLLGDAFLPLLAANGALEDQAAFSWWWLGYPGDL